MSDEPVDTMQDQDQAQQPAIDAGQVEMLRERLRSDQSLFQAILTGTLAALAGAALWALITVFTGFQIGFMAIAVGALVGFAIRLFGKGVDSVFGIVGAILALIGCLIGNLMAVTALAAADQGVGFFSALAQLNLSIAVDLMKAFFSPIDLLFYGIALYEGYKLSFRTLSEEQLRHLLAGSSEAATST